MNKRIALALFALLAAAQLYAPASMIWGYERTLSDGELVKIRCQPVDPADAFRGRFVALSLNMGMAHLPAALDSDAPLPERGYALLETDGDGFASWGALLSAPPETGVYVKVSVYPYYGSEKPGDSIEVEPPVDRFYLPEEIAPEAERIYFDTLRAHPASCYVAARVYAGTLVLQELYLNDTPVVDYVREMIDNPPPPMPEGEGEGEGEGQRQGEGEGGI